MAAPCSMLTPDDADRRGLAPSTAKAMPAISPPPESGTTIVSSSGRSSRISSADRALAGDDVRMVEGRDVDQAFVRDQPVDLALRVVLALADDADRGAERVDGRHLVGRHQLDMHTVAGMPRRLAA